MTDMTRIWMSAVALMAAVGAGRAGPAAAIAWRPVRDVAGDSDVAADGRVVKAYTFATGNRPVVNGVRFSDFGTQSLDTQTFGSRHGAFFRQPSLSDAYNALLAGGLYDAAHLGAPASKRLVLNGLIPGRRYQVQIWVADDRSWPGLVPPFSSSAQTVRGSAADTDIPTLCWEGGPSGPIAQYAIGTFTADRPRQALTFTPTAGFFNGKDWFTAQINALVLLDLSPGEPPPAPPPPPVPTVESIDDCNVVWDSPSADSFGSMPIGNGDVGANVWVEEPGDLVFYVSKVDAYDAGHLLRKLGRVRLRLDPPLSVEDFRQELVLRDGAIAIRAGGVELRVWVDANHPVIRVTGTSATPVDATASFETLRSCVDLDDRADRLAWGYRNETSAWMDRVRAQSTPEFAARVVDPILGRTSGCRLSGEGFIREGRRSLRLRGAHALDLSIQVLSSQAPALDRWFADLDRPAASDWEAHRRWWAGFWDRSWIFVVRCGDGPVQLDRCRFAQFPQGSLAYRGHQETGSAENAFRLSQRYALERFAEACAGRGAVPQPYNGSIFTMDMPAGAMGFAGPRGGPASADDRDWAVLSFMWQNTRHPYWAMAARGDYDTLLPGMEFVRGGLDVCRDRCRKIFGHDGAFIMEASWWHDVGAFDWDAVPQHLRYHFLATVELPAIMCEYYEHTTDRRFLDEVLLPCADEATRFYELQFPRRDGRGRMVMAPAAAVETYQPVTNPCTEIGGLRFLLQKLLGFEIGDERRERWSKLLAALPGVPLRRILGVDLLAVGEEYAPGREICESPEMYSVYPFRQVWLGNDGLLAAARQSMHLRTVSLDGTADGQAVETGGWQAAPVQAAYLGLAREAARLTSINFEDRFIHWTDNIDPDATFPDRPRPRFPAFWETKMDYTPDNDHGANSANALQSMLLQSDGRRIFLLPAWPEDWDVSFRLRAAGGAMVECVYRDGKVRSLRIEPEDRRRDIVDLSTPESRIRTMVSVACADRNWLFGLPPMLDGLPVPGPATGPWLARFGESLTGVRAGPWPGCVFRDEVVYVHGLGGRPEPPPVPARLVRSTRLTGEGERPDEILKLEYDRSVEPFARAAVSAGSLVAGKAMDGGEIDLGCLETFDRIEFIIENPGHRRGQGKPFELQAAGDDGSWRTVYRGAVYGTIFAKRIDPVTARRVRLEIGGVPVKRLDLFPRGK